MHYIGWKNHRTAQYIFGIRIPIKLKLYKCLKKNFNLVFHKVNPNLSPPRASCQTNLAYTYKHKSSSVVAYQIEAYLIFKLNSETSSQKTHSIKNGSVLNWKVICFLVATYDYTVSRNGRCWALHSHQTAFLNVCLSLDMRIPISCTNS